MSSDWEKTPAVIGELRGRLDEIDGRIIELIAERQSVINQIGEHKHKSGRSLRDFAREREVIELGMERAERLGIPGAIARDILERLIHYSLGNQELRQLTSSEHGKGRRALVIGGLGRMGDWMARYLDTVGYAVMIADHAEGESFFPRHDNWDHSAQEFDLIVVAVPLRPSNAILHRLADIRPGGLIFDIGSLKGPMRSGLEALREAGCKVCSVHPMFGPGEKMLSGRHILFVEVGDPEALAEARALFAHTAAECVDLSLEEHDEVMAWVLGLSHLMNIAFAESLAKSGEAVPLLRRISSSTFNAQLNVASQVVSENPHLYFEIQAGNERTGEVFAKFREVLDELARAISEGDESSFVEAMESANRRITSDKSAPG